MSTAPHTVNWSEHYILMEHWKSDLEFYKDDLRFLHHLIEKYFMWITKTENMDMVREVQAQVFDLKRQCETLISEVNSQMHTIGTLVEQPGPGKSKEGKTLEAYQKLESDFANFVKSFRANRKEVFKITEYVINSEDLPSLLGS